MRHKEFSLRTGGKTEISLITDTVYSYVASTGLEEGLCTVYCPHTTAGLTINEAADPSVASDLLLELNRRVPLHDGYTHGEGNSAAHIKATLTGSSVTVPIRGGKLKLGTWQGIYFCEFDGPRNRTFSVTLLSGV